MRPTTTSCHYSSRHRGARSFTTLSLSVLPSHDPPGSTRSDASENSISGSPRFYRSSPSSDRNDSQGSSKRDPATWILVHIRRCEVHPEVIPTEDIKTQYGSSSIKHVEGDLIMQAKSFKVQTLPRLPLPSLILVPGTLHRGSETPATHEERSWNCKPHVSAETHQPKEATG
jgi:hypothetical protein